MKTTFTLNPKHLNRANVLHNAITFIVQLPDDKPWDITVERHVKARSDKQRRSLFGVAYKAMMEFSGLQGDQDKRDLHAFWCKEYYGTKVDAFGREVPVRTTTKDERGQKSEISTVEALEFYSFLQRRGAEVGCYVPDPDVFWREKADKEAA